MQFTSYFNISAAIVCLRKNGFKQAWKIYRWQLVLAIFLFYLIRDVTVYLVLPYFLSRWII